MEPTDARRVVPVRDGRDDQHRETGCRVARSTLGSCLRTERDVRVTWLRARALVGVRAALGAAMFADSSASERLRLGIARRGRQGAVWWGGLFAAAIGVGLALSGTWAAVACFAVSVVLLWLSGFWVGPRTPDAYMRRLLGTSSTWVADTQWSYDVYSRESAKLAGRIARLVPPADFADDHGQLAGILADASRGGARSLGAAGRADIAVARRRGGSGGGQRSDGSGGVDAGSATVRSEDQLAPLGANRATSGRDTQNRARERDCRAASHPDEAASRRASRTCRLSGRLQRLPGMRARVQRRGASS